MYRIGIDLDGVLCDFNTAYADLLVRQIGRDLLPRGWGSDAAFPPCWDWPVFYGYTPTEMEAVWNTIKASSTFWEELGVLSYEDLEVTVDLATTEEVYFITSRVGETARGQAVQWLKRHNIPRPTVLRSSHKGMVAKALELHIYVDDWEKKIADVRKVSPRTRAYLLDRPYNQERGQFTRLRQVVEAEGLC